MCRPSCCNNSGGQGAGIAAVASSSVPRWSRPRSAPSWPESSHVVLEVIRIVALTTGLVVALAVITWAVVTLTRWQLRRRRSRLPRPRWSPSLLSGSAAGQRPGDCLACGGTGTVLRAIGGGRYQPGPCPVCEPAHRAG